VPDAKSCLPTHTGVSTDFWGYDTNWPEITAGECNLIETSRSLLSVGIAGYGTTIGYLCADLPVTPTTWGGVKSVYGDGQERRNP